MAVTQKTDKLSLMKSISKPKLPSAKIAIGTAQFGSVYGISNTDGEVVRDEAKSIVEFAHSHNIRKIDTAIAYGESESILGEVGMSNFEVITKLASPPKDTDDIGKFVIDEVEGSLSRLKINHLHGVLLHSPTMLLEPYADGLVEALNLLRTSGKVHQIGVSVYEPEDLDSVLSVMKIDMVQAPLSILDTRFRDTGWLEKLKTEGISFQARSIFLQGLLLMDKVNRPEKFSRWNDIWKVWDEWLLATNLTPLQACVQFAFAQKLVNSFVVGFQSTTQITEVSEFLFAPRDISPEWPDRIPPDLINPSKWNLL